MFPGRHLLIYPVKLRQSFGVPELDGSWGIPYMMAASRFEYMKLPGGLRRLRTGGDSPTGCSPFYSEIPDDAAQWKISTNGHTCFFLQTRSNLCLGVWIK